MPANAEYPEPAVPTSARLPDDSVPQDIDSLLQRLTPPLPTSEIVVRGIVKSLSYFPDRHKPTRIYGDLLDAEGRSALSFSCPATAAPELVGEPVILRGRLQISTSPFLSGLKVQLAGRRLGSWTPAVRAPAQPFVLPPERTRVSLAQLLAKVPATPVLLLGTATGIADAMQQLGSGLRPGPATRVVAIEPTALLRAIADAAHDHSALCLLRGGGDPAQFAPFNDPELVKALLTAAIPIYTAVGHATDLTLADKYADQSFPTPTAFGSAYLAAHETQTRQEALTRRLQKAEREANELKAERGKLYRNAQQERLQQNLQLVSATADKLRELPQHIGRQTSQEVIQSLEQALQRLPAALPRPSRLSTWPVILIFFLLGCVLGALACYRVLALTPAAPPAPSGAAAPKNPSGTAPSPLRSHPHRP